MAKYTPIKKSLVELVKDNHNKYVKNMRHLKIDKEIESCNQCVHYTPIDSDDIRCKANGKFLDEPEDFENNNENSVGKDCPLDKIDK